jgi:hypothetical protein
VDWFNEIKWKQVAEFVGDWRTIIGAIVAIGTSLGAILLWFRAPLRWLMAKFLRPVSVIERPLRFVTDDRCTVHTGLGADEKTGTHILGTWYVTNASAGTKLYLLKVRLGHHIPKFGTMEFQTQIGEVAAGPLLVDQMRRLVVDLQYVPPIHVAGEDLIIDVTFTDNYGVDHLVPSVRFRRAGP